MKQKRLFELSDAALKSVIDTLTPQQLALPAPSDWVRTPDPLLLDVVRSHARDEAWVPDVLAGRTLAEVGTTWDADLLGDDPIRAYDELNDLASAALDNPIEPGTIVHLSYGDFPVETYFEHVSYYRAFQAWAIGRLVGVDVVFDDELVELLWESVEPQLDDLRAIHVFPPEVVVPEGSSRQVQLLGKTGFYTA